MKSIILIGMPGAGKSTVGVVLAKALGMDFIDSDLVILRKTGAPLQKTLDRLGLEDFLHLEETVIRALVPENTVLATGGSVPLREKSMEHLRRHGAIVYLQVPYEELARRLSNIRTRGIAFRPGETLRDLYEARAPVYARWADITVPWSSGDLEKTVEDVISALDRWEKGADLSC